VKATRQFHNRLQDALVIIHSVVKNALLVPRWMKLIFALSSHSQGIILKLH